MRRTVKILVAAAFLVMPALAPLAQAEDLKANIDDAAITTKVKTEIIADQLLKGFDIHVATDQQVVHLTGNVDSESQKSDAQRIAQNVDGVKDIKNDIAVR